MQLKTTAFSDGGTIPEEFAFGQPDDATHVALAPNRNPDFEWADVPMGTRSLALLCIDSHVPSSGDDVNKEGREIPADLPRVDFAHWTLVNIDARRHAIARGEYSDGVTPHGKPGPAASHRTLQGINDFTGWFTGDAAMAGDYFGYDGPCPPWNDARLHHYRFTLYALDVERLDLIGAFTATDALRAMAGHVLAEASVTGRYTLNPRLR